jgi:hypothetical protein
MTQHTPAPLPEIIDRVLAVCEDEIVTLGDIVASVGRGGFAALLLVPAVAVATPLSGIPMFSALMGTVIALVAGQMLLRRRYLWLPEWVTRRKVSAARVGAAFTKLRPVMEWIEARTKERFTALVHAPFNLLTQGLCFVSGAMMPLLEFVPFSSSVVGLGVVMLTLGMLTRDGLLAVLALVPYAGVAALIARFI